MMVCSGSVLLKFPVLCFVVWSDLLLPHLWAVFAFSASKFLSLFFSLCYHSQAWALCYCTLWVVVFQFAHTHTHTPIPHTQTCHTHFVALFAVLICIDTGGGKINKDNPQKSKQCQKLYLKFLKELCIRFWLVFLRRCNPWVIPWRNNSLFVWQE